MFLDACSWRSILPYGRSNVGGADAQGAGESDRDYLNGLVEASVANTANQVAQLGRNRIADIKSLARKVKQQKFGRVDIMHYHISPNGHYRNAWSVARKNYRGIMRDPLNINFITVLREPRSHFLSYYYFYFQPENQLSLEEYLMKQPSEVARFGLLRNPLSGEFGVRTLMQLEHFIAHELSSFKLLVLTERFDEGLMVLRRLLGWNMIDMTYEKMKVSTAGAIRWDGRPLVDRPSFDDLPEQVQNRIDALTELDQLLYTAAQEAYAKSLQLVSNVLETDLEAFAALQSAVSDYLDANDSSKANALYRSEDWFDLTPPLNPF